MAGRTAAAEVNVLVGLLMSGIGSRRLSSALLAAIAKPQQQPLVGGLDDG
jgi:hypothetical protein